MSNAPILWGGASSAANSSLATNIQSFLQTGLVGTPPSYPKNYQQSWYFFNKDPTTGLVTTLTSTGNRTTNSTFWGASTTSLLTYITSSATYLRPPASAQIAITGAAGAQFVESPMITLDNMDLGTTVYISFDCQSTGTFASGDITFQIINYNSGGTYIGTITPSITNIPSGTQNVSASFTATATSGAQYSIRWLSNNASARTIIIDSFFIGTNNNPITPAINYSTYTPIGSGGSGHFSGTVSFKPANYVQIGSMIVVSGQLSYTGGSSNSNGIINITLPVATANFTQTYQVAGVGGDVTSNFGVASVYANIGAQTAQIQFVLTAAQTTGNTVSYIFMYQKQ